MLFGKKVAKKKVRRTQLMEGQQADYVFRRSRTLTGTTSSKVMAGAETRGQLKTERLKAHEQKLQRHKLYRLGMVAALMVGALAYVGSVYIKDESPFIYPQLIHAATDYPTASYQKSLAEYFGQHPEQRFGPLLKPDSLEAHLRLRHGEIGAAMVHRSWYGAVVDTAVYFRKPLLMWQVGQRHYYVDAQGVAFEYTPFKEKMVTVTDQSGIVADSGSSVASTRFIQFLGKLVGSLGSSGRAAKVTEVIIPRATREIDIRLEGRGYPIKTHIDRDPLRQAEDIINALGYFDAKGIKPQYVDVRVEGKAYYK